MRVIAGKARRLSLKTLPGENTRPTTDRIKETLFNMLQSELYGSLFLDLFSGSGAIGIEAASRGAKHTWLVEKNRQACSCIRENLAFTRLSEDAELLEEDVFTALHKLNQKGLIFDFIFMDPPYHQLLEKEVLSELSSLQLLHENSVVIVEAALDTPVDYMEEIGYDILKIKEYKTNKHIFLNKHIKE